MMTIRDKRISIKMMTERETDDWIEARTLIIVNINMLSSCVLPRVEGAWTNVTRCTTSSSFFYIFSISSLWPLFVFSLKLNTNTQGKNKYVLIYQQELAGLLFMLRTRHNVLGRFFHFKEVQMQFSIHIYIHKIRVTRGERQKIFVSADSQAQDHWLPI